MRKDKIISLVIALVCAAVFYSVLALHVPLNPRNRTGVVLVPLFLLFPLALIWFGDELGAYTGPVSRGYITQKSPGCLVKLMGWIFLLGLAGVIVYSSLSA